jgi:hypothetical protein
MPSALPDPLAGSNLDVHLAHLESRVESGLGFRAWSQVAFIERGANWGVSTDLKATRRSLDAFRSRWAEIVQESTGWVNLVAIAIEGGALIVAVEWKTDGSRRDPDRVSVNHSWWITAADDPPHIWG